MKRNSVLVGLILFVFGNTFVFAQDYKLENRVLIPDSIVHKFIKIYDFPFGADPIEFQSSTFSFIEKTENGYQLWNMDYNTMQLYCYDLVNQKMTIYGNGKGKGPGELLYPPSIPKITKDYVYLIDRNQFKVVRYNRGDNIIYKEFKVTYPMLRIVESENAFYTINMMFMDKGRLVKMNKEFQDLETYGKELFFDYGPLKSDGVLDENNPKRMYLHFYPLYVDFTDSLNYNIQAYHNFNSSIPLQDIKYDNNRNGNTFVNRYNHTYVYMKGDTNFHGIRTASSETNRYYYDLYSNGHEYQCSIFINKLYRDYLVPKLDLNFKKDVFQTNEGLKHYLFVVDQTYTKIAILDMFECAKYYQAHYQKTN